MMIKTSKVYILISVGHLDLPSMSELENYHVHFLANLGISLDEIQGVATVCWFVEAHAKFTLH